MIELAGYRYAVGIGTARLATALLWASGLTYALYATFWALLCGRFSADATFFVGLLFIMAYPPTILLTAWIVVVLLDVDKQRVKPDARDPVLGARVRRLGTRRRIRRFCWHLRHSRWRIRRWWSESEAAAWTRSTVGLLTVVVLAAAPVTAGLSNWNVPAAVWMPIMATEIALMVWHLVRLRRLRNRMRDEATTLVDGQFDLYRDFDWDRYDNSDAGLFRRRFTDVRWKLPAAIIHRAEAAIYAQRARNKQSALSLAAATTALVVVAIALTPAQAMFHRMVTFSTPPPPDPGIKQIAVWCVCLVALLYPTHLKQRSRQMGELAKIYEDRCDTLGNKTSPTESDPQPAAKPASRGTVIRIGRHALRLQRIEAD